MTRGVSTRAVSIRDSQASSSITQLMLREADTVENVALRLVKCGSDR